jgi:hypothetical protein
MQFFTINLQLIEAATIVQSLEDTAFKAAQLKSHIKDYDKAKEALEMLTNKFKMIQYHLEGDDIAKAIQKLTKEKAAQL